ncbi:hypothetical protein [Bacillus mycoides]|uniref:hypothetical protein n=1 Tax=Bacillus mycoides TaxID=1405 RepID=UPI00307D62E9
MSQANLPNITPNISITNNQSIALLLSSIALEEMSLAHIINAEAEKIQFIIGTLDTTITPPPITTSNLFMVNQDVRNTLKSVIKKEMLLEMKLKQIINLIEEPPLPPLVPIITFTCGTGIIEDCDCEGEIPVRGIIQDNDGNPIPNVPIQLQVKDTTGSAQLILTQDNLITDQSGKFSTLGMYTGTGTISLLTQIIVSGTLTQNTFLIEVSC